MRVNDNGANPLTGAGIGGAERSQGTQGVGGAAEGRRGRVERGEGDSVQLSSLGQALQAEDVDSPERQAQVAQLRADFQAGKYQIDTEALSSKIVDDALKGGLG